MAEMRAAFETHESFPAMVGLRDCRSARLIRTDQGEGRKANIPPFDNFFLIFFNKHKQRAAADVPAVVGKIHASVRLSQSSVTFWKFGVGEQLLTSSSKKINSNSAN